MQRICLALSLLGIAAYVSGNDHFLNGGNLVISVVTLMLLPLLQASQTWRRHAGQAG